MRFAPVLLLALTAACTVQQKSQSASLPANETQDDKVILAIEPVDTPAEVLNRFATKEDETTPSGSTPADNAKKVTDLLVEIAKIVNIGKELWQVVEDNRPVTNIKYDYATALPAGITVPEQLDGFSSVQHQSFKLTGTNDSRRPLFEITVTLMHQYNGSFDGKGKYLANVAVVPSNIKNSWGHKLDVSTAKVQTTNIGTKENPIASMTMELHLKDSTVFRDVEIVNVFEFRGDKAEVTQIH